MAHCDDTAREEREKKREKIAFESPSLFDGLLGGLGVCFALFFFLGPVGGGGRETCVLQVNFCDIWKRVFPSRQQSEPRDGRISLTEPCS